MALRVLLGQGMSSHAMYRGDGAEMKAVVRRAAAHCAVMSHERVELNHVTTGLGTAVPQALHKCRVSAVMPMKWLSAGL